MTCLLRANVGAIEAVHGGVEIAARILAECVAVAKAGGVAPDAAFIDQTRELLTSPGSALTSSMYRDMQSGQPVEVEHILGDLIARARAAALDTPLLDAACASLRIYAATRAPALRAARPNA
jgi:2-dehydropantoate 2-reductase